MDGTMQLTVTFKLDTDPNIAQVLVQNRVAIAEPQLPLEVRNIGVTTQKQSPDILMAIGLTSKSNTYNPSLSKQLCLHPDRRFSQAHRRCGKRPGFWRAAVQYACLVESGSDVFPWANCG